MQVTQQHRALPPPMQPGVKRMRLDKGAGGTVSTGAGNSSIMPQLPSVPTAASHAALAGTSGSPIGLIPLSILLPPAFGPSTTAQPAAMMPMSSGFAGAGNSTASIASPVAAAAGSSSSSRVATSPRARDSRGSPLSPPEKVQRLLERFPQSFCQELQIDMASGSAAALWQWLCASVLFSARIKSNAAVSACQELFHAGLTSAQAVCKAGREHVRSLLAASGYDKTDKKTAGYLVDNAEAVMKQWGGDLGRMRQAAGQNVQQERTLLKKLKGTGDGAVDIFFRQAQVAWQELFPFGDKKALRAARLVGLKEHPQALAELCGGDRLQYARLLAALVRVDMAKAYSEF